MQYYLLFKTKANIDTNKHKVLEILFKDWVDDICNNKVDYFIDNSYLVSGIDGHTKTFRVDFQEYEDALALKLKGIPVEFREYLEIVN